MRRKDMRKKNEKKNEIEKKNKKENQFKKIRVNRKSKVKIEKEITGKRIGENQTRKGTG